MKVIDNFLPSAYQDAMEELMLSQEFPWYLNTWTLTYDSTFPKNNWDTYQFTHRFYDGGQGRSQYYNLVSLIGYHLMLTENVDTSSILRIKANLNVPVNGYAGQHYPIHVDYDHNNFLTCIYYVNDSDGDTIFFNQEHTEELGRVSPKKGRLVYFDGNTPHAGCPPTKHDTRCIINLNFKPKETK